jgi:hypothetical protein
MYVASSGGVEELPADLLKMVEKKTRPLLVKLKTLRGTRGGALQSSVSLEGGRQSCNSKKEKLWHLNLKAALDHQLEKPLLPVPGPASMSARSEPITSYV